MSKTSLWDISSITVRDRHRRDLGDIDGLAASIEQVGLLHPVVIRTNGRLIAGERRIAAFKKLGRTRIPATVVDLNKIVLGEYAENTQRKDFTYSEAVAIARELRPIETAAAKERQREAGKNNGRGRPTKTKDKVTPKRGNLMASDKAAKATGKGRTALEQAEAIVVAAEKDPVRYGDLAKRLDEPDVKVNTVHREMRQRQERETYEARAIKGGGSENLAAMAAAGEKFKVIYADPPWEFKVYSGKGKQRSADRHYDTSSLEAIKALPVAPLADDNCTLFLWGVWPELPGALEVIKAWGFEYKTIGFLWVKTSKGAPASISADGQGLHWGLGYWTRANSEFCLLATKGSPMRLSADVHQVIVAPVGEHSAKPAEVRERIMRLLTGPYLELFARRTVPGWTVWGNEVEVAEPQTQTHEAAE
jgi:N6-adenosine-specific RNA methylase IME4